MNPRRLTVYIRVHCHLCEQAERLLAALPPHGALRIVDISADETLLDRYGVRIPVLRDAAGRELDWPFSRDDIIRFLRPGAPPAAAD